MRLRHPRRALVAALATCTLAVDAGAQSPRAAPPPRAARPAAAPLDSAVRAFQSANAIPAVSVAILRADSVVARFALGHADLEHDVPATPATMFRLGSISKPVTAMAAARLAERGALDLDAPVQRYVPAFPDKGAPVTSRQLMSHTAGVRHYRGREIDLAIPFPGLDSALAIFAADPLVHAPGAGYTYSTYGYTLLGAVVERACGVRFMACIEREVLAPAGIRALRDDHQPTLVPHRARPYGKDRDGRIVNAGLANTSYKIPGGGMIATAEAVARFGVASMSGRLVSAATWTRMTTPVRTTDGRTHGYGEGWTVGDPEGLLPGTVRHGGAQQGTSTILYLLPRERLAIAVLTNMEGIGGARLMRIADDLARLTLEQRAAAR